MAARNVLTKIVPVGILNGQDHQIKIPRRRRTYCENLNAPSSLVTVSGKRSLTCNPPHIVSFQSESVVFRLRDSWY
jgi:hypothetical protein